MNAQDFQIQALMEYKNIEHKSYVSSSQSYAKNINIGRRMGSEFKKNGKPILEPSFYTYSQIMDVNKN